MLYPVQNILDFVFPPTPHEILLRTISTTQFVTLYQPQRNDTIEYLAPYQLPVIQAAITACKFEHSFKAARLLGALFETYLKNLPPKKTLLIPIPLSTVRERDRGFNQVNRALSYVGTLDYEIACNTKLMVRTKHTIAQTTLNRAKRVHNLKNAFACKPQHTYLLKNYERIIICDDVSTTGSTLLEAQNALSPYMLNSTELRLVAWAH